MGIEDFRREPTMTKYEAMFGNVRPVEIERENDKSVWIDGHRRLKDSSWQPLFDTPEQAWDHVVAVREQDVKDAEKILEYRRASLDAAKTHRAKALLKSENC